METRDEFFKEVIKMSLVLIALSINGLVSEVMPEIFQYSIIKTSGSFILIYGIIVGIFLSIKKSKEVIVEDEETLLIE